jgi:hypothetical protein
MATDPIICPTCHQPGVLPQLVHYYKSYKIVPFHCGACGRDWSLSTLTTLPPRSDWLEGQGLRNQPTEPIQPVTEGK